MIDLSLDQRSEVAKYLGVERIDWMDDVYNESGKEQTINWKDNINVGSFFFPKFIDKDRKKTFYARKFMWIKNGKRFGCLIEPEISGTELDIEGMIKKLREKIKDSTK